MTVFNDIPELIQPKQHARVPIACDQVHHFLFEFFQAEYPFGSGRVLIQGANADFQFNISYAEGIQEFMDAVNSREPVPSVLPFLDDFCWPIAEEPGVCFIHLPILFDIRLDYICSEQLKKIKKDFDDWKEDKGTGTRFKQKPGDFKNKKETCKKAIEKLKMQNFAGEGRKKSFETAMESGGKSLASALTPEKLLALMMSESSFGTSFAVKGDTWTDKNGEKHPFSHVGPFQLGENVVTDFNDCNPATPPAGKVKWPDDIDGVDDKGNFSQEELERAAEIAAFYLARNVQQLTHREPAKVTNPAEANKLAIAMYKEGPTTINNARKEAGRAGKDMASWDGIKNWLEGGRKGEKPSEDDKKTTIKGRIQFYVEKILVLEDLVKTACE